MFKTIVKYKNVKIYRLEHKQYYCIKIGNKYFYELARKLKPTHTVFKLKNIF